MMNDLADAIIIIIIIQKISRLNRRGEAFLRIKIRNINKETFWL